MVANAARRSLAAGEDEVVPRVCDLEALRLHRRQGRDRVARGGPRRPDPRPPRAQRHPRGVPGPGQPRAADAGGGRPSRSRDPVETGEDVASATYYASCSRRCRRSGRRVPSSSVAEPTPRRGGLGGGADPRGPAPVQAAQQGRRRRPGPVPRPRLTASALWISASRGTRRDAERSTVGPPARTMRWRVGDRHAGDGHAVACAHGPAPIPLLALGRARSTGFELDALDVMEQLTDDLLYHGDLNAALRRMMQQGFEDRNGERIQGMREMLEKLREQREETARPLRPRRRVRGDRRGAARGGADRNATSSTSSADDGQGLGRRAPPGARPRSRSPASTSSSTCCPPTSPVRSRVWSSYDFLSHEAEQRFEELIEQLREQLMQQYVDQMSGAMQDMSPEDMARMKDMMAELNQMLEQRAAGEEPDFDGFMERFGDFFPENPQTLDELLEVMARRMAAAQAMMNSMTPEQRAQLQQLSRPAARGHGPALAGRPARAEPARGRSPTPVGTTAYHFEGADPLDMAQAMQADGRARRPGPARAAAARCSATRRARRGRPRPGPGAAGRRVGRQPRAHGRDHQDARPRPVWSSSRRAAWS